MIKHIKEISIFSGRRADLSITTEIDRILIICGIAAAISFLNFVL